MDMINVSRSDDEQPVPTIWRNTLSSIVESFKNRNFLINSDINDVLSLSEADAKSIEESINSYGCSLVDLPEETWITSVCQWTGHHWDVMVDLFTEDGLSDLVMFVRVSGDDGGYSFTVDSVHVP